MAVFKRGEKVNKILISTLDNSKAEHTIVIRIKMVEEAKLTSQNHWLLDKIAIEMLAINQFQ